MLWGANQLRHYKQFWRMWRHRPTPILMSQYSGQRLRLADAARRAPAARRDPAATAGRRLLAPALLSLTRRRAAPSSPPIRSATWKSLVEIWAHEILPQVPGAALDVYGVHALRPDQDAWTEWAGTLLPAGMPDVVKASVVVHPTRWPRAALLDAVRAARVMLYLGHKCEAFCLSLAEAQAMGTPAVVAPVAVLPERVIDGVTGFHRQDPAAFGAAATQLLTDDGLWRAQHEAALRLQQGITVAAYAQRFEAAILPAERARDAAA